jgi:hypothetical protein
MYTSLYISIHYSLWHNIIQSSSSYQKLWILCFRHNHFYRLFDEINLSDKSIHIQNYIYIIFKIETSKSNYSESPPFDLFNIIVHKKRMRRASRKNAISSIQSILSTAVSRNDVLVLIEKKCTITWHQK